MNRLGFIILSILDRLEAKNKGSGLTLKEITEHENFGYVGNTFYKKIKDFVSLGYIAEGYKDGRAATYYLTASGIKILSDEREGANT